MLQQGKDLAFFRNRETSKGGLLLGLLMKTDWVQKYVHMLTNFDHIKIAVFLLNFEVVTFIAMNYKQKGEFFAFFKL